MMTNITFRGVITALITPFNGDKIDLIAFETLIKRQMQAHIDAILLFGSTGEPLSLSESEKKLLFFTAKEIVKNKLPILTGISSPITKIASSSAVTFERYNSDGLLVITPYYYRCTSEGIFRHFFELSNATNLPIIAYNVPSRTNIDLLDDIKLFENVCKIKNIRALKIANANQDQLLNAIKTCPLPIFCGCDENMFFACKNGAVGSISVISNAYPSLVKKLHDFTLSNDLVSAERHYNTLRPMVELLATYPNPIAIKCLLSKITSIQNELRLPLTRADEKFEAKLNNLLNDLKEKI